MSTPAVLTLRRSGEIIQTLPLDQRILVGRGEDCLIRVKDRNVSRHHALFQVSDEGVIVEKKSEFAPLLINGVSSSKAVLKHGDVVAIGPYEFELALEDQKGQAGPAGQEGADQPSEPPGEEPHLEGAPENDAGGNQPLDSQEDAEDSDPEGTGIQDLGGANQFEFAADSPSETPELMAPGDSTKTNLLSSNQLKAQLIFKTPDGGEIEFDLTRPEILLGRSKECQVVLKDKKSSRKNSRILRQGAQFVIEDMDSVNGTFVNGVKIKRQELASEDVIRIGNTEFKFKAVSLEYLNEAKNLSSVEKPVEGIGGVPPGGVIPDGNSLSGLSGVSGIAGIAGIGTDAGKKKTLLERFKALPKRTQIIAAIAGILLVFWLMEEDPPAKDKKKKPVPKNSPVASPVVEKGPATFESLTPEQKKFVETQHALAFDYYRNKEYDKALFEIEKIFSIIQDYKDSREIQRYAKEGKRKLEAIEEERRKKEEEAKLKAKILRLVDEAKERMSKKQYEQAKELFSQILALDPDNAQVAGWKAEIEAVEEQRRLAEQQRQVRLEILKHARHLYEEAQALEKQKRYHPAIRGYQRVIDTGVSSPRLIELAKAQIKACRSAIQNLREPVLASAKKLEESGSLAEAFALYKKATQIDPPHRAGYAGMNRIRGVLHDRAKTYYTEAIIAESYSDFENAKKFYKQCLATAPQDDIYYERAKRKLSRYFQREEPTAE